MQLYKAEIIRIQDKEQDLMEEKFFNTGNIICEIILS